MKYSMGTRFLIRANTSLKVIAFVNLCIMSTLDVDEGVGVPTKFDRARSANFLPLFFDGCLYTKGVVDKQRWHNRRQGV